MVVAATPPVPEFTVYELGAVGNAVPDGPVSVMDPLEAIPFVAGNVIRSLEPPPASTAFGSGLVVRFTEPTEVGAFTIE
jgi:hypothetical protein